MPIALVVRLVFWLWFAAAVFAGQQLVLQRLPPVAVPGLVCGLTALLLLNYFRVAALRAWVDALDLRTLVLLHVTRFVGFYFLVLYGRGELPYAFAVPGGWSDIIVAFLALGVVFVPLREELRRHAYLIWNTIGLVDMLLVVTIAARIEHTQPWQLSEFQHLPLSMLPTFLVPLLITTHVIIYARLREKSPETASPK